uniref:Ubiquitin-like protease family profile domain-containing protein n=1 Tax=Solanum lycopersicum TaxID=4081 RepID=A0A3Q7I2W4_SOLLC
MSSYFSKKIVVPKSHLRALFLAKKFIDNDLAVSLVVLYFINDFLFSYEDNEYQIINRDFHLMESEKFNSYPWGLDIYKKLSDSVRHELKSTHKYYRIGDLPLALQIWIFECCSKVDEDIAIRVADSIPRILNWKTIAESPWLKYIEKCLFMPTKNKFENIVASEDEVSKFRLPETRDYHAEILKLEPKGPSHALLFEKSRNNLRSMLARHFSGGLDFNGDEDVAGIAIEKVLSEVVADINVQEAADVNTVGAKPDDALNVINLAFELGICTVDERLWFFNWHILDNNGVMRTKGKYETNSNVRFTTTDCVLKTKITNSFFKLCDAHEDKKNFKVLDSDDIARYINGHRLLASTSRDKVNFVLIPLNIKENRHWIFGVFDIGQRSLEVYDSFPARGGVNLEELQDCKNFGMSCL